MSNQYKRTFVTLKQGNSNYTLMGEAMGRCILEARGSQGKISFLVQNLKPEVIYKAYIIADKDGYSQGVLLGSISVDKRGKGELKKFFNTYNVEDTGLGIDRFKVAVILVNEKSEIIDPLVGYIGSEISWKQNFKKYKKPEDISKLENNLKNQDVIEEEGLNDLEEEIKEIEEEIKEIEEEIVKEIEEIEEEIEEREEEIEEEREEVEEEIEEEEQIEEEREEQIDEQEDEQEELDALEEQIEGLENSVGKELQLQSVKMDKKLNNNKMINKVNSVNNSQKEDIKAANNSIHNLNGKEIHEALKSMAEEVNKELTEFKYYALMTEEQVKEPTVDMHEINNYRINNNLDYIFANYMKMVPFKKQSKNVKWIRISLKETVYLPIDFWYLSNDPFIVSCYKRYKHLILGVFDKNNEKEYLLGVPDMYKATTKVRANSLGFIQFKCCEDIKLQENSHGYWIMPVVIK